MTASQDLRDADAELAAGRWGRASELFTALADTGDVPRALEGLAQAAWWLDDAETALGALEAAYRSFRANGEDRQAARAAASLGYDSMLFGQGRSVGRGWLALAADLLAGAEDSPEAGWLAVRRAEVALNIDHDAPAARDAASRARGIGRETAQADMAIVGQAMEGLAKVRLGDVDEGMSLLDSAVTAATVGDVADLMWMGKICCFLLSACEEVHDLDRAGEWCLRVQEICVRRELAPLFEVCRTKYASVLLASGRTQEAEAALVDVLERVGRSRRVSRLQAVAQLGEVRRRQGRVAEAEELLHQARYLPVAVTSLAQLRLDTGEPGRAWSTITELLRWVPPEHVLERVDALAVAAAAGEASGDEAGARRAADELRAIAAQVGSCAHTAHADAAEARLATGAEAVTLWQDAVRGFHAAGLAFDEAEARLRLARVLRAAGDEAEADEQERSAAPILAPLHASADTAGPLTQRQAEVLRLLAQGRSNAEIAAGLQISEHTVHRHVANIYSALDLGSRAAAAAYAVGHGLS